NNITRRTGLRFGLSANLPIDRNERLFFQPGIFYAPKGAKVQQVFDTSRSSLFNNITTQHINYVDLPLNLVFKLPLSGKSRLVLGAGPQASLFYNGKVTVSSFDTTRKYKEENATDLPIGKGDGKYRVGHFAVNALAGFESGRVYLTANWSKGLNPFYEEAGKTYKHMTMAATLGIYLGKPVRKGVPVRDRDGDGIEDEADGCPDLAGTTLTRGCPDRDADGIADPTDACPDRAGTAKYKGCPVPDSDGDGVNDEADACPAEKGAVANKGCPEVVQVPQPQPEVKKEISREVTEQVNTTARQIQFKFRQAELTASSFSVLDELAQLLQRHPEIRIQVEGHTSVEGSVKTNQKLSQDRADAVRNYLITKGVSAERVEAKGLGSSRPLVKGMSEKANIINRRVEIKLLTN
ncbi:MAG TPA: OmpA family protein, partial [Chitinophagaceae bacterium]|nr:OmpA family protein [Chitinophagaceae bacterium]